MNETTTGTATVTVRLDEVQEGHEKLKEIFTALLRPQHGDVTVTRYTLTGKVGFHPIEDYAEEDRKYEAALAPFRSIEDQEMDFLVEFTKPVRIEREIKPGERTSYTIITACAALPDARLFEIVKAAADTIAAAVDDGTTAFDVDVIEGTFGNPLSGDNVHGLGRFAENDVRLDTAALVAEHDRTDSADRAAEHDAVHNRIHALLGGTSTVDAEHDWLALQRKGNA